MCVRVCVRERARERESARDVRVHACVSMCECMCVCASVRVYAHVCASRRVAVISNNTLQQRVHAIIMCVGVCERVCKGV